MEKSHIAPSKRERQEERKRRHRNNNKKLANDINEADNNGSGIGGDDDDDTEEVVEQELEDQKQNSSTTRLIKHRERRSRRRQSSNEEEQNNDNHNATGGETAASIITSSSSKQTKQEARIMADAVKGGTHRRSRIRQRRHSTDVGEEEDANDDESSSSVSLDSYEVPGAVAVGQTNAALLRHSILTTTTNNVQHGRMEDDSSPLPQEEILVNAVLVNEPDEGEEENNEFSSRRRQQHEDSGSGGDGGNVLPQAEIVSIKPWYVRQSFILLVIPIVIVVVVVSLTTISRRGNNNNNNNGPSSGGTDGGTSTTISPSPTMTLMPTATPSSSPTLVAFITVQIQLDEYPMDTGWLLKCDDFVLQMVAAGDYVDPNQMVTELVQVTEGADCVFTITDEFNDGICCANGEGFYRIYYGESTTVQPNNLLVKGGEFLAADVVSFTVRGPAPTISPSPTRSLVPSMNPTTSPAPTQRPWYRIGQILVGDAVDVQAGSSISLSNDGKIVAVGQVEDGAGSVKIFQYNDDGNGGESSGANWIKLGQTIFGETSGDEFGVSVSLSSDGKIVAIGGRFNSGNSLREAGHVQVFRYDATQMIWTLIGQEIYGDDAKDRFGSSVALSSDGTILACGAPRMNSIGYVRVYSYEAATNSMDGAWSQLGEDIVGDGVGDRHGFSVALSSNGNILAVTGPSFNVEHGDRIGRVKAFERDTNTSNGWVQLGQDLDGEAENDNYGRSVSLSSNGTIMAIGSDLYGGTVGLVRVFQSSPTSRIWTQMGQNITGLDFNDQLGQSVSLSVNGTTLGVGVIGLGIVQVYQYDTSMMEWIQVSDGIVGEEEGDLSGHSVALSGDGSIVAFGAPGHNSSSGAVSVYTRN